MDIELTHTNGIRMAEIISNEVLLTQAQDALELIAACGYQGADNLILHAANIIPSFFDLSSGIAGEILQKFSTYRVRLAVVGDFSDHTSQSLRDFITESNRTGRILFVASVESAREQLARVAR